MTPVVQVGDRLQFSVELIRLLQDDKAGVVPVRVRDIVEDGPCKTLILERDE